MSNSYGIDLLANKIGRGLFEELKDKVEEEVHRLIREHFADIVKKEAEKIAVNRVDTMKDFQDFSDLVKITINICKGDCK